LRGLKERKGTIIHLSGAGNFLDGAKSGTFSVDGKIWNVSSGYSRNAGTVGI